MQWSRKWTMLAFLFLCSHSLLNRLRPGNQISMQSHHLTGGKWKSKAKKLRKMKATSCKLGHIVILTGRTAPFLWDGLYLHRCFCFFDRHLIFLCLISTTLLGGTKSQRSSGFPWPHFVLLKLKLISLFVSGTGDIT